MRPVTLYRVDPGRNMRRFYHLDIQPDLFGNQCLVRRWGRIGSSGQIRIIPYSTKGEAQDAFDKLQGTKERKGYLAA
jgi:predicted DNA-binding WGR domain protein